MTLRQYFDILFAVMKMQLLQALFHLKLVSGGAEARRLAYYGKILVNDNRITLNDLNCKYVKTGDKIAIAINKAKRKELTL